MDAVQTTNLDDAVLAAVGEIMRGREANGSTDRTLSVAALRERMPEEAKRAFDMDDLYASVGRLVERGHLAVEVAA